MRGAYSRVAFVSKLYPTRTVLTSNSIIIFRIKLTEHVQGGGGGGGAYSGKYGYLQQ